MKKLIKFAASIMAATSLFYGCSKDPVGSKPEDGSDQETPDVEMKDEYDVFLLIGQSNMAGRGKMLEEDKKVFDENVYLLNDQNIPVPATNPLNQYSTIRKDIQVQGINPGFSFSKKIAKETGKKVLLVVNARGGSRLSEWKVGSDFYKDAVRRTKEAMKYGQLKGILWHQGESDSGAPSHYLENLKPIVEGLRAETGAAEVPFIAGEIAPWHSNRDKFNPVIRKIGQVIPHSDYVISEGCTPLIDTHDPHFSREGQILIGERYANKILKYSYGKEVPEEIELYVEKNALILEAAANSTAKLTFSSNGECTLEVPATGSEWLEAIINGKEIQFTTKSENTAEETRETEVKLIASKGEMTRTQTITIGQKASGSTEIQIGDLYEGGMVFVVETDHIKIMSIDETTAVWSTKKDLVPGLGDHDLEGLANTLILKEQPDFNTAYPAAAWCTAKGEGWYMPSRKELANIYNALISSKGLGIEKTNALLESYHGTGLANETYYWSSCQKIDDGEKAWRIKMNVNKSAYAGVKSSEQKVRAIKKINK